MSEPRVVGFEYEVRIAISLPIAWTTLLKQIGANHYDAKCRTAADHGVINGLHNCACDGEFPSNHAVSFSDLDLITKVMEQAPRSDLARQIRDFVEAQMYAIAGRRAQLESADAAS